MSSNIPYKTFKKKYGLNVKLIDASKIFLKNLKIFLIQKKKEKLLVIYLLRFLKRKQKNIKMLNFWLKVHSIQILLKANPLQEVKHPK